MTKVYKHTCLKVALVLFLISQVILYFEYRYYAGVVTGIALVFFLLAILPYTDVEKELDDYEKRIEEREAQLKDLLSKIKTLIAEAEVRDKKRDEVIEQGKKIRDELLAKYGKQLSKS